MDWLLYALVALFWPQPAPAAPPGQAVTIPLDPVGSDQQGPLPRVTAARGDNPPLVVIDAGHGGQDPGAASPFTDRPEKDITLAIALAMRDALAASGRVRVALTREDDRYLVLEDRYRIARRLDADLFISVHADTAPSNDQARGATIYTLSEVASDREAALLAERQNASNAIAGARLSPDPNVNLILIDLAQRESMNVSAEFAQLLLPRGGAGLPLPPDLAPFRRLHRAEGARHPVHPVRERLSDQRGRHRLYHLQRRPPRDRRGHAPRGRSAFRAAVADRDSRHLSLSRRFGAPSPRARFTSLQASARPARQ